MLIMIKSTEYIKGSMCGLCNSKINLSRINIREKNTIIDKLYICDKCNLDLLNSVIYHNLILNEFLRKNTIRIINEYIENINKKEDENEDNKRID